MNKLRRYLVCAQINTLMLYNSVAMARIMLNRPRILAVVGQLVTSAMP